MIHVETPIHILAAVLATYRVTEIVTADRIGAPIRKRWPIYLWTCPRCVSVWAGAFCTGLFLISPWLNWPFALSWVYLWHVDSVIQQRLNEKGKEVTIGVDAQGNLSLKRSDLSPQEIVAMAQSIVDQNKPKIVKKEEAI